MRQTSRIAGSIRWAIVGLLCVACSRGTDEAKRGVAEFRNRMAQRAFGEIYRAAAPEFRAVTPEDQFVRFMTALERKLGVWQSAADPQWNFTRGTGGHLPRRPLVVYRLP